MRTRFRLVMTGIALTLVLIGGLASCGRGGGPDAEQEAIDEASFCRMATQNSPVSEASAPVLERMSEVAADEVDQAIGVLRDLADRVAKLDSDDSKRLKIEFEVRFSEEYIAAQTAVGDYIAEHCSTKPKQPDTTLGQNTNRT